MPSATSSTTAFPFNTKDQFFYYDGEDVSLVTGSPLENARFLHGPAVDEVLARKDTGGSMLLWVYADHLGSVRDVMQGNAVFKHMDYSAFGTLLPGSNAWYYGFTGREYDSGTGLNYHRHQLSQAVTRPARIHVSKSKPMAVVMLTTALLIMAWSTVWVHVVTRWRNDYVNVTWAIVLLTALTLAGVGISYLQTNRALRTVFAIAFTASALWLILRVVEPILISLTAND